MVSLMFSLPNVFNSKITIKYIRWIFDNLLLFTVTQTLVFEKYILFRRKGKNAVSSLLHKP